MLYNFIVWACWTKTQSCLGSKPKLVLTIGAVCGKELDLIWGDSNLALKMEESGSHQPTIGPHQDDANLHQAESGDSQHNNLVANPQRRGGNLTQRFVHDIISKAFMAWALILTLMAILLIGRESLTGRSFGSSPICSIIYLVGGQLGVKWWVPSLYTTQLFLQFINFTLHVPFTLCMGNMALPSWLILASMRCMHTSLLHAKHRGCEPSSAISSTNLLPL